MHFTYIDVETLQLMEIIFVMLV